jgi:hypothetical protein
MAALWMLLWVFVGGGGSRMASMTFGMGIGVGSAYEECSKEVSVGDCRGGSPVSSPVFHVMTAT